MMSSSGETWPRPRRRGGRSTWPPTRSGGHHFEHVPVRVLEVEAAAATAMVDLHVAARARPAAIGDAFRLDPVEDRVEFGVTDPERVVMAFELLPVVEI